MELGLSTKTSHDPSRVTAAGMVDLIEQSLRTRYPKLESNSLHLSTNLKRVITFLTRREDVEVNEPLDVTPAAFRVLAMLSIFGQMESRDVCRLTGVSRQAVSTVLANLERRGFVERKRAESTDRRQVIVGITNRGEELITAGLESQNRAHARFFSVLDESERVELNRLLRKLVGSRSHP